MFPSNGCRCWPRPASMSKRGIAPGGTHANHRFLADWVSYDSDVTKEEQLLLCDAQTSGGLLAAVPAEMAAELLAALRSRKLAEAAIIGRIDAGPAHHGFPGGFSVTCVSHCISRRRTGRITVLRPCQRNPT